MELRNQLLALVRHQQAVSDQDLTNYINDVTSLFSCPFIISMRKDAKKYKSASSLLTSLGLNPIQFHALEKDSAIRINHITDGYKALRPAEKGCLLSHMSILALAAAHPNPSQFTLIFEDDITSPLKGDTLLQHLRDITPVIERENASIIHLGKCLESCTRMEHIEGIIWRSVAPSCSHAIAVKNAFARRIIEEFKDYNKAVDFVTGDYIKARKVVGLNFHPGLFYQDVLNYESSLRAKEQQINNYLECSDCCKDKKHDTPSPALAGDPLGSPSITWMWTLPLFIVVVAVFLYVMGVDSVFIVTLSIFWFAIVLIGFNDAKKEEWSIISVLPAAYDARSINVPLNLIKPAYNCFNPNMVIHREKAYLVARIADQKHSYTALIVSTRDGTVELETTIDPAYGQFESQECQTGIEDMRVFVHLDRLWLIGTRLNDTCLPGMVLFDLQHFLDTGAEKVIPLTYPPVMEKPNKNWSPLSSPDGKLLIVVNFDPLLIVEPNLDNGACELYYQSANRRYNVKSPLRNSTITYCISNTNRYIMLLHCKYIGTQGTVYYQHYFGIIDLDTKETKLSEAFNVEREGYPPIEYISGAGFDANAQTVTIKYGLQDKECKSAKISYGKVMSLFREENLFTVQT
jgi:GR25 family glycosyltransferase involved in LPS biosynthesis